MTIAGLLVVLVLVGVLATLALTRISPDAVLMAGLTALLVLPTPAAGGGAGLLGTGWTLGVLSVGDAISGFANPGLATVAALFVVVCGLRETGGVDWIAERVLGRPRTLRMSLVRIFVPVVPMSAFLNNTPIVAMLIPAVIDWSKKLELAPSKLLIPLSYAAILGGTCSLIGTSTNLVVSGLVLSSAPEMEPIGMFTITAVGVPAAIVGCLFLLLVGPRLLPQRVSASGALADPREYTLELLVPTGSPMAGKTVESAGLRALPGCYLVEIEREGYIIAPVRPDQELMEGDRLLFAGVVDSIKDLPKLRGLAPATDQVFKLDSPRYRRRLFEAVVSPSGPMIGKNIREGRFRNRYDGAVIAVARSGVRVRGKVGDIVLRPGDVLLVEADPGFAERNRNSRDFLLVSALEDSTPRRHTRAPIAIAILGVMVVLAATGVLPMLAAALVAAGAMVGTRCCTITEGRGAVDWSVLVVIGAALGIGRALDQTGVADAIAGGIIGVAGQNPWLVLVAVYLTTSLFTELITNNAAVALSFPIAQAAASALGVDFLPFVIAIMMAGSASFATPLGYQTNLMVMGPGGYSFRDFFRIGAPMNLLVLVVTVIVTPLVYGF